MERSVNTTKDSFKEGEEETEKSQTGIPHEVYIAVGTVLAALITAFINYTRMIISKDQEVTQLRTNWIKDVTNALAQLCAEVELLVRLVECKKCESTRGLSNYELKRIRSENKDHYKNLNEAFYTARMLLDPKKNNEILEQMRLLYNAFYIPSCANLEDVKNIQKILIEKSQSLNEEIRGKIESGDVQFRTLQKFIILGTLPTLLVIVGIFYYVHFYLHWL